MQRLMFFADAVPANGVDWVAVVSAAATVVTAALAVWAVRIAQKGVDTAVKTLRAGLFVQFSNEYASDKMHSSLALLAKYGKDHPKKNGKKGEISCDAYVSAVRAALAQGKADPWNAARRRVSKFYLRAMDLVRARLLDEGMLARLIRPSSLELYLNTVVPLERAHNTDVLGRTDFDETDVRWWEEFLGVPGLYTHHRRGGDSMRMWERQHSTGDSATVSEGDAETFATDCHLVQVVTEGMRTKTESRGVFRPWSKLRPKQIPSSETAGMSAAPRAAPGPRPWW